MVDIPAPTALGAYLDDIVHDAQQVRELYRWAYPNTWSPPDHGHSAGRSASRRCGRCKGAGRVCGRCQGQLSGDATCPSEQCREAQVVTCPDCGGDGALATSEDRAAALVLATERYRKFIRHAAREVLDARNRLRGAVADLNDALALLDPPQGPQVADVRLLPHPADGGDVRRARAAQARRQARAEASGTWDEVTG